MTDMQALRHELFDEPLDQGSRARLARVAARLAARTAGARAVLRDAPSGPAKAKALATLGDVALELLQLAETNQRRAARART